MAIPTGEFKAVSDDCRINYNLLPGEVLMTCPYNLSHAVRKTKFASHVLNCYRLHCKEQASKGQPSLFAICKFERTHHVRNELLAHHESTCEIGVRRAREDVDDDWGMDPNPFKALKQDFSGAANGSTSLDSEADWEDEPCQGMFDPEQRIRELRKSGYAVVKYPPPGLSKSEKKEFYEKEKELMTGYSQMRFLQSVKQSNTTKEVQSQSSASVTYSAWDDGVAVPIKEEEAARSKAKGYTP
ncbi:Gametocyte-specific factor 1 [Orchesella cincta]|uniref:Gametocyte-specific factor 1 n=1 Tax=Orchesella cincta TaxID=48709 RepID=A0A1D2N9E4_ORCCI|nr:Gametocyte-specific factor 1 [Orchesella cincta]